MESGDVAGHAGGDDPAISQLQARVARLEQQLTILQNRLNEWEIPEQTMPFGKPVATPPPPPQVTTAAHTQAAEAWIRPDHPRPVISTAKSPESFEDRLGSQIFNRIAIVLLLIGTAYGLKLAVDRGLIGPTGRVLAGLIGGAGIIVWSERFRQKGFAAFSYSLKAVGSGVLYLSLWAGFQLFHLLSAPVALVMMVLVSAWNAYMAWAQDSELLAVYALAGAFATPLLISTGTNHEVFLFTYLLAINVAAIVLVRLKSWPRLLLGTFPATMVFFIAWYFEFFAADEIRVTTLFVLLFGAAFAWPSLGSGDEQPNRGQTASLEPILITILLPLANAAFVAVSMYSMLDGTGHHSMLPWLMVAMASAYLALMSAPQSRTASAVHLSLGIVFLTIAIPLKASGHWITVSWLVEGLALLWVATRLQNDPAEEPSTDASLTSATLRWLGIASIVLGFCGVMFNLADQFGATDLPFWNKGTGTALTGVAIFAAAVWLAMHASRVRTAPAESSAWSRIALIAYILIPVTALLLTARELLSSPGSEASHPPFQSADFFTALLGLAVMAGIVATSLRIAELRAEGEFWTSCAALATIAFNLVAVLAGVREVSAIWEASSATQDVDRGLRQALAISAWLMFYGAALLAAGFWKRNAFLRWQALVLLIFTICKTFLYDMRSLSQGYRVVSLLGLGVLLMAISYAYQKDWLGLRVAPSQDEPHKAAE